MGQGHPRLEGFKAGRVGRERRGPNVFVQTRLLNFQPLLKIAKMGEKLQATDVGSIPGIVNDARNTFHTQKTKPLEFRKIQLRKLYWG